MAEYVTKAENQQYILGKIRDSVIVNRDQLLSMTDDMPVSVAPWLTRNILELVIWAEYCRSSAERAHEFMLDGARDGYDALKIPEQFLSHSNAQRVRDSVLDKAQADGFNIEESYTKVINAAKEMGHAEIFRHLNKTFSKFAHPTAFAILSLGSKEEQLIKEKAKKMGEYLAAIALRIVDLNQPPIDPFPPTPVQPHG